MDYTVVGVYEEDGGNFVHWTTAENIQDAIARTPRELGEDGCIVIAVFEGHHTDIYEEQGA